MMNQVHQLFIENAFKQTLFFSFSMCLTLCTRLYVYIFTRYRMQIVINVFVMNRHAFFPLLCHFVISHVFIYRYIIQINVIRLYLFFFRFDSYDTSKIN